MANSTCVVAEMRFDVRDEQITHCYVLVMASYDAPIGVQGWHYKAFPARIPVSEILTPAHFEDHLLWPLKAPEKGDWYMTINADRDIPPETAEALAVMGQLVVDQYTEQDKGSAIEDADYMEIANKELAAAFARLQSEHSDLIERERLLESNLSATLLRAEAAERQTRVPDMVIDGYVNYVNLSKMIGNPVMPFSHWLAEGDK